MRIGNGLRCVDEGKGGQGRKMIEKGDQGWRMEESGSRSVDEGWGTNKVGECLVHLGTREVETQRGSMSR